jgi:hypothetical protein
MESLTSNFPSTRRAVLIGAIRWPNLRKGLINASDRWLYQLEELMVKDQLSLGKEAWRRFHAFTQNFEPVTFSWNDPRRMTTAALDYVFLLQEKYLGFAPSGSGCTSGSGIDVPLHSATTEDVIAEGDPAGDRRELEGDPGVQRRQGNQDSLR